MKEPAVSQPEMVALVRDILDGQDLTQITAKIVRDKVIARLGDRVTADVRALKASVKAALEVVLADDKPPPPDAPEPPPADAGPHEGQTNGGEKRSQADPVDKPDGNPRHDDADDEFEPDDVQPARPRKRRRVPPADEGDPTPDGDVAADPDAAADPDGAAADPAAAGPDGAESDAAEAADEVRDQRGGGAKRSADGTGRVFSTEAHFSRLKHVCRQIGCPAPPSRQKGRDMRTKCLNLVAFLRTKGVTEVDPTKLRREEIAAHRKRIEREKELEGLDVSNIIEDEGRSRRRRAAAAPRKEDKAELPSDLSGPDLSVSSEDDGEEYAVSDADSE